MMRKDESEHARYAGRAGYTLQLAPQTAMQPSANQVPICDDVCPSFPLSDLTVAG